MTDLRPDTEWAPMGRGSWRWLRGVQCWAKRLDPLHDDSPWTASVDARHLSSVGPSAYAEWLDTEADARAWCERWADVIAREYDALGRAMVAAAQADEREACALVLDALAAGVRWHETGDARVDAARRRGAETTRAAHEQGARSIRARGGGRG